MATPAAATMVAPAPDMARTPAVAVPPQPEPAPSPAAARDPFEARDRPTLVQPPRQQQPGETVPAYPTPTASAPPVYQPPPYQAPPYQAPPYQAPPYQPDPPPAPAFVAPLPPPPPPAQQQPVAYQAYADPGPQMYAQAPQAEATNCYGCGASLRPTAKFCGRCGTVRGATAAPAQMPRLRAGATGSRQLGARELILGGAFAAAAISPFLPWLDVSGFTAKAIGDHLQLRIAKTMGTTSSIDGFVVLFVALAGLAAVAAQAFGGVRNALTSIVLSLTAFVFPALAIAEYQYLLSQPGMQFSYIAIGTHLFGAAALVLALHRFIPKLR